MYKNLLCVIPVATDSASKKPQGNLAHALIGLVAIAMLHLLHSVTDE